MRKLAALLLVLLVTSLPSCYCTDADDMSPKDQHESPISTSNTEDEEDPSGEEGSNGN